MGNVVTRNRELPLIAKSIYSYFASFAGAGTSVFSTQKIILRELAISQSTYYKHFTLLVECGYITSNQTASNRRFGRTIYELNTEIEWHSDAMSEKTVHGNFGHTNINNNIYIK